MLADLSPISVESSCFFRVLASTHSHTVEGGTGKGGCELRTLRTPLCDNAPGLPDSIWTVGILPDMLSSIDLRHRKTPAQIIHVAR